MQPAGISLAALMHRWPKCLLVAQAEAGSASQGRQSSLKNLSAFLTLSKAQDRGFDASKFGLSSDEAADIATVFSRFV